MCCHFWVVPHLARPTLASDPTNGFVKIFGLGGRACKQYDDIGKLCIYSEGFPAPGVILWLQRSDTGTKANTPMPQELAVALPLIPSCLPGKHHVASANGLTSEPEIHHTAPAG